MGVDGLNSQKNATTSKETLIYVGAKKQANKQKKHQLLGEVAEGHGDMSYLSATSILNV